MAKTLGKDFRFLYSSTPATDGTTPSLTEGPTAAGGSISRQRTEISYENRENGGQTQYFPGSFQESLTFSIAQDSTDDFYTALDDAYNNGTELAIGIVDKSDKGMFANWSVLQFDLSMDQSSVGEVSVNARPSSQIDRSFTYTEPV